jgi:hypothetical protein
MDGGNPAVAAGTKYAIAWIEVFGRSADRDAGVGRMREGPPSQSQDHHSE